VLIFAAALLTFYLFLTEPKTDEEREYFWMSAVFPGILKSPFKIKKKQF
jgi:hypothetical protein